MPLRVIYSFKNLSVEEKRQTEAYMGQKCGKIEKRLPPTSAYLRVRVEKFAKKAAYKVELELKAPHLGFIASEDDHTIQEAIDFTCDKLVSQVKRSGMIRPSHHKFPRAHAIRKSKELI